ncbi:hypothetical protein ZWY2020_053224 [Hordeum vulgare]|nr:hypothetical protein ZWY2020_053224 [Hordeum vulgare]
MHGQIKSQPWRRCEMEDANNHAGSEKEVVTHLVDIGTRIEEWKVGWRRIFADGRRVDGRRPLLVLFGEEKVGECEEIEVATKASLQPAGPTCNATICQVDQQRSLYARKSAFWHRGRPRARAVGASYAATPPRPPRSRCAEPQRAFPPPNASSCYARHEPVERKSATIERTACRYINPTVPPSIPASHRDYPLSSVFSADSLIYSQARKLQRKVVMAPRVAVLLLAVAVFFASASAQDFMAPSSAPAPAPDAGAAASVSALGLVSSALVSLLAAAMMQ